MTKTCLLFVPTNRDCSQSLPQFLKEAAWAAQQPGNSVIFCVIEHSLSPSISKKHAEVLASASSAIKAIHFSEARQLDLVNKLLTHETLRNYDHNRLRKLLLPRGISYGRGPNLAYLLAESLGAASIHRRDSDITIENMERVPIELEVAAINQPLDKIGSKARNVHTGRYAKSALVTIVGTSVYGDAVIDRRDLYKAGIKFLTAFQSLGRPGVSAKEVEQEATNYLLEEPKRRYTDDFYEVDLTGKIEMGAVCISDIYRYLPEMPTSIIGCDYMLNDLNWRLHKPALFHSRKVQHAYDRDRADHKNLAATIDYALRDVQYIQMGRIWSKVGEQLEKDAIYKQSTFNTEHYATIWAHMSKAATNNLRDVRLGAQRVYTEAAYATKGQLSQRLQAVADALEKTGEELDRQVVQAVNDYVYLAKVWPKLMTAARQSNVSYRKR